MTAVPVGGSPRVLFIGNSYTHYNLLPVLVSRLAAAMPDPLRLRVRAVTRPGYTLRMHWKKRKELLSRIRNGKYSHVVLQGHSLDPIDRIDEFQEYASRFDRAIDAAGAQTVLYQTWARHPGDRLYRDHPLVHSAEEMFARVDDVYARAAHRLDARLAPVGLAFKRALQQHPDLRLYRPDGSHPSRSGTFLAACVIFGSLTDSDPARSAYRPHEISRSEARKLKQVAAAALAR